MDQELLDLLARLQDETRSNPLTDEELATLKAGLQEAAASVDTANLSDEDIQLLAETADCMDAVNGELDARAVAAEERQAEAAALLERIAPPAAETTAEGETTAAEGETGAEGGEGETAPVETAPAGEPVAAGGAPAGAPGAGGPPAPASMAGRRSLPTISALARNRPKRAAPVLTATAGATEKPGSVLVAAADIPGVSAGAEVDLETFAHGAMRRFNAAQKIQTSDSDGDLIYFGTIQASYDEDRWLDMNEQANEDKMRRVVSQEALVASGGVCAPVAVDYSLSVLAVPDRPVKGALAQFGASRGGLRYILPHTLAQVTADGPAGVWTEANDVNPTSPTTKPHATFVCQTVQENYVDTVTSIAQFGNFQARYFPEQIAQYMETVEAVHSRVAEANLLAALSTGSTAVTGDNYELGAARDFLSTLDRAASALRYRHRMQPETPIRVVYPYWLNDMFRADMTKQLPGDSSAGGFDRLGTDDGTIANWFKVRNINTTLAYEAKTSAATAATFPTVQGAGQLVPWPLKSVVQMYPEGSWVFLDGGELNLGMVRDSTLNATNNFQMFSETFEKAIFRGHESMELTLSIAPTGGSAGTIAPTGSSETLGS